MRLDPLATRPAQFKLQILLSSEAIVVVRESCSQQMTEVLEGFQSQQGVRLKFSLVEVPEQEDWGTADSLRALRGRVKVGDAIFPSSSAVGVHVLLCLLV